VLIVDLLPNMIDTVVIGDRLFSLPIQVEGREENEEVEAQMDVDEGGSDKANDSGNPPESRDTSGKSNATKGQASGSGQKIDKSSDAKNGSGPSQDQNANIVRDQAIADDKAHHAYTVGIVKSGLNFSQNTCGSCNSTSKEKAESVLHAGQQEIQYPSMFKEAHPCTQHVMAPGSNQGNKGAACAYLPGDLVQNGNTKQVANLLSSMNDNITKNVNSLCNDSLSYTDQSTEPVEHPNSALKSTVISIHCTVSHGTVSGAKNPTLKSKTGNSSMNHNQELHDVDQASTSAYASIMSHAEPEAKNDFVEKQGDESSTLGSTLVKRSKRREGSVDEDSNTRAQRRQLRILMLQVCLSLNPFYHSLMIRLNPLLVPLVFLVELT
jgi:hypothetical protein